MAVVGELLRRWQATVGLLAPHAGERAVTPAGQLLLERWGEPHRHYHNLVHLRELLAGVDVLADLPADVQAVRAGAWFHDAVYEGRPGADEQASAALARQVLTQIGVVEARVEEVARLVLLTSTHDPAPGDSNGEVLCDADLWILAAETSRYDEYRAAVREEYPAWPEAAFRLGRGQVLRELASRPALFRTPLAREHWESRARANLERELADLRAN